MIHVNERDFPVTDHHCNDPEKKKLVMKLALMITDNIPRKLPGGMKENHMDFWILDRLLTKEEVRFMLSFKKRRVGLTTRELAVRNKMSMQRTQKMIDHLLWIGILEQNRDNADHHIQYLIPKWVVGSGEYMVEHPTLADEHPEVATMFNLAPQEPLELAAKLIPPGGAGIGMHVIPVEKAIPVDTKSVSVEHLSHWIQKYDTFCKMVCACRKAQRIRGEGVGDIEGYMCIGCGDIAEYLVTSGKDAVYITKEEVLEILERAERKGYVHQITNLDGPRRICPAPLTAPTSITRNAWPAASASRYVRPVPQSSARSCAGRTARRSFTRCMTFRMTIRGARIAGTEITGITIRSTATTREHPRARRHVRPILRSRAMSGWLPKAAIRMRCA